ncbi:DUF1077 domain-containing protein [Chloropicon primus]|nr:DUF1077 domain-containing protein [Chloropicon primus]
MTAQTGTLRRWRSSVAGNGGGDSSALVASPLSPSGYNHSVYLQALREDANGSGSVGAKVNVDKDALMEQKAWEFAQSTVKQVGMYAFMMYMSGGSVHIFSIMMTFTGLYQPLMAIFNSGKAFEKFSKGTEGRVSTLGPRALYCLIQMGGLGFALYKLANIGLLPTHISDWVSGVQVPVSREYSARA